MVQVFHSLPPNPVCRPSPPPAPTSKNETSRRSPDDETHDGDEGGVFIYRGEEENNVPRDVKIVKVHPSVKAIEGGAFSHCSKLAIVSLGEGLKEIGSSAFFDCKSLHEILIPTAVKAIKDRAFAACSQLTTVNGGEGLEEIEDYALLNAHR